MAKPRPTTCQTCGTPISQEGARRPRLYCSDKCRHHEYDQRRLKGCKIEGCTVRPTARGYCPPHYYQAKNAGEFGRSCSVEGCERPHAGHGLCATHLYHAKMKGERPSSKCTIEDCDKPLNSNGLCNMHQWRKRTKGETGPAGRVKRRSGEGSIDANGYISIQVDKRRLLQHQQVMEQMLGRRLQAGETVHHKNGQRADNRPENLELWSKSQPAGQRVADKVAWAIELLALYQPDALA